MDIKSYDYFLPEKNLALEPAVPRDSSKLFVYDTDSGAIVFDRFYNLDKYLPKDSFMVMNNTKVLPARVVMTRLRPDFAKATSGKQGSGGQGKVVVLFLVNEIIKNIIPVMVDRKINVGEKVYLDEKNYLTVIGQNKNIFDLKFDFSRKHLFDLLKKYGAMPIPPYLKKSSLTRDELIQKYQTIFAKTDGSAAAPTASLHFTDEVFKKIRGKRIERFFVTLHVGLGTFAPINEKNIEEKRLHEEYYEVPNETIKSIIKFKKEGKKLVAVGTTVVRTLESEAQQRNFLSQVGPLSTSWKTSQVEKNLPPSPLKKTDLFILPPCDFKLVDMMITNFHLPRSSLMMLVEAFLEFKGAKKNLVDLYKIAIEKDFRFYSFGDAMLII